MVDIGCFWQKCRTRRRCEKIENTPKQKHKKTNKKPNKKQNKTTTTTKTKQKTTTTTKNSLSSMHRSKKQLIRTNKQNNSNSVIRPRDRFAPRANNCIHSPSTKNNIIQREMIATVWGNLKQKSPFSNNRFARQIKRHLFESKWEGQKTVMKWM